MLHRNDLGAPVYPGGELPLLAQLGCGSRQIGQVQLRRRAGAHNEERLEEVAVFWMSAGATENSGGTKCEKL